MAAKRAPALDAIDVKERHHAGRQPMAKNSKTIAGLIGPSLIALAAALLINLGA